MITTPLYKAVFEYGYEDVFGYNSKLNGNINHLESEQLWYPVFYRNRTPNCRGHLTAVLGVFWRVRHRTPNCRGHLTAAGGWEMRFKPVAQGFQINNVQYCVTPPFIFSWSKYDIFFFWSTLLSGIQKWQGTHGSWVVSIVDLWVVNTTSNEICGAKINCHGHLTAAPSRAVRCPVSVLILKQYFRNKTLIMLWTNTAEDERNDVLRSMIDKIKVFW